MCQFVSFFVSNMEMRIGCEVSLVMPISIKNDATAYAVASFLYVLNSLCALQRIVYLLKLYLELLVRVGKILNCFAGMKYRRMIPVSNVFPNLGC